MLTNTSNKDGTGGDGTGRDGGCCAFWYEALYYQGGNIVNKINIYINEINKSSFVV